MNQSSSNLEIDALTTCAARDQYAESQAAWLKETFHLPPAFIGVLTTHDDAARDRFLSQEAFNFKNRINTLSKYDMRFVSFPQQYFKLLKFSLRLGRSEQMGVIIEQLSQARLTIADRVLRRQTSHNGSHRFQTRGWLVPPKTVALFPFSSTQISASFSSGHAL